jgi:hypothetical protein
MYSHVKHRAGHIGPALQARDHRFEPQSRPPAELSWAASPRGSCPPTFTRTTSSLAASNQVVEFGMTEKAHRGY